MARERSSSTNAKLRLLFLLAFPVLLYCIPQRLVFGGPTVCLFRNLFGTECYGCGMTRALFSLLHFDLSAAWSYNRLVVVVAPLLAWLYLKEVVGAVRALKPVE
ncbi:DUF2752 domain-containing protein [Alistipes sp.]|uniref:DUF2752 domain-containing protein n=1 Tax=Alistipes sp. TaxID=1872444 RepID=UPI003AF0CB70